MAALWQVGHVWRRWRWRRPENIVQEVLAADHRRGPGRVRRDRQHAPVAQQSCPPGTTQPYAPEMRPIHVPDPIEARQPFVRERVVRRQQLLERAILTQLALEEQLGLAQEGVTEVVVEFGKRPRVGIHRLQVPDVEPLAAEICHKRRRSTIGKHPPNLRVQDAWSPECPARRHIEQLIIRDAAPQKERQSGGQLEIADLIDGVRLDARGIALDAEQEVRGHQQSSQCLLNALLEVPLLPTGLVEPQQRLDVRLGDRPAIGSARERRQDLGRAGFLAAGPGWLTDEDPAPARCVPGPRGVVRTFEPDIVDVHTRCRVGRTGVPWRQQCGSRTFRQRALLDERDTKRVHPGRGRETNLERIICRQLVWRRPIDARARTLGIGIVRLDTLAADAEPRDPRAVQEHVDLFTSANGTNLRIGEVPSQTDLDNVLAVKREVVANKHAAARGKRQVLAHPVVLPQTA